MDQQLCYHGIVWQTIQGHILVADLLGQQPCYYVMIIVIKDRQTDHLIIAQKNYREGGGEITF